ncbi:MAG TPA: alpha/beta hydrolase [Candidatus Acidoferrales bacterium]|nr:alpha/beta hydrolase [Candidatus Acidoferrales bacterium]
MLPRRLIKRIIEFAFFLTMIVSGFGCSDGSKRYPVAPPNSRAESFVKETRLFEIGSEKYDADFGTITVSENRSRPASRLINIPFLRIHSHSRNPAEPIFGLAGGPGQSNMSWDRGKAWTFLPEHDFVLVGYRGVDGSTVLDCPDVTEAFKKASDPLSEESMKMIGRAWGAGAERLKAQGVDLDGYSMIECIEDNESVRTALGYDRIDLLSESYGTRVAYLYGLKHPERIFRSAMIGVNPPGHFVWEPQTVDEQLKRYANLWSWDSTMTGKSPDLYRTMRNILNNMPPRWLVFPINPGKVKVVTFALLFHRSTAAMAFDAYVAAEHGDPSGLALMSLAYDYVMPSLVTWGDLASKAVGADFDSTRNYSADMEPRDLPLGSPMGKLLWGPLSYGHWPMTHLPEKFRKAQRSNVETLLLSGSVDFSTPPEFATNELLPYLKNCRQIILSECGHVNDIWYAKVENTRLILTSFYDKGVPNTSLNSYIPMNFGVSWGFALIAKAALAAIVVVVIAFAAIVIWFIRRYRRRHGKTLLVA